MVWYSHLFQNFPQLIVIHTIKGFGIVNKAEIDVFLELSCFFNDPAKTIRQTEEGSTERLLEMLVKVWVCNGAVQKGRDVWRREGKAGVWMKVCDIVQRSDQDHLQEKEMQKGKMVV